MERIHLVDLLVICSCHPVAMPLNEATWTFEHTVECAVPMDFAWGFWTDVKNWELDADVTSLELDGQFAAGARGVTHSKSSGTIEWRIADVRPGKAVIEFPLTGAVGRFVWTFEDLAGRTRITQCCTLEGEQASRYAETITSSLEAGIPDGMKKLCEAMEKENRNRKQD